VYFKSIIRNKKHHFKNIKAGLKGMKNKHYTVLGTTKIHT